MYKYLKEIVKYVLNLLKKTKVIYWKVHYRLRYKGEGKILIDSTNVFHSGVRVLLRKQGNVIINKNNNIQGDTKIVINGGTLNIGNNCSLGENNIINVFDEVILEDNVLTADRVSFITNIHQYENICVDINHQPTTSGKIVVGNGTWLGINAVVLANTTIGRNCVVAANAVVKGNYPDYCVIAGVPGKIVKKYNQKTNKWEKVSFAQN